MPQSKRGLECDASFVINEECCLDRSEDLNCLSKRGLACLVRVERGLGCLAKRGLTCLAKLGLTCLAKRGLTCLARRGLTCLAKRGLTCLAKRGLTCLAKRGLAVPRAYEGFAECLAWSEGFGCMPRIRRGLLE